MAEWQRIENRSLPRCIVEYTRDGFHAFRGPGSVVYFQFAPTDEADRRAAFLLCQQRQFPRLPDYIVPRVPEVGFLELIDTRNNRSTICIDTGFSLVTALNELAEPVKIRHPRKSADRSGPTETGE